MGRLSKNENSLTITFKYDPKILNVVREIDGRKFNAALKRWEVPLANIVDCWEVLKPLGFTADAEVLAAYNARKAEIDSILSIKQNDAPYTGTLPLFDFQRTGTAFLRALPAALLADVPGLGKTLQTAAAFEDLNDQILIFVPASLKFNWHDEIKKWLPDDKVVVIHGDKQERTEKWIYALKGAPRGDAHIFPKWVIANYELLIHDFETITSTGKVWGAIVCDEADRIANPFAKTTQSLKLLKSHKRIALTGTPISNTPEDLWSIIDWLYPRYLGTFTQFQKKYCKIHPKWNRVIGYINLDQLKNRVEPIMLRRLKEQVLKDFPPKTVEYVKFDLEPGERALYESVKKLVIAEIKKLTDLDTRSLGLVPVKMLRLKQCTDHASLIDAHHGAYLKSSKLETLKEMLKPIAASGEKSIVFTQFSEMAHILKQELADYRPSVIWGGVDPLERKHIVDEFKADPEKKVLIMTEAGTYGLNLQAATYVFHYDGPWSVSKIEQREGRAHRVGQDKPVTVYHLVANKTIDEYILKVLSGKQKMSQDILGDRNTISVADINDILGEQLSLDLPDEVLKLEVDEEDISETTV